MIFYGEVRPMTTRPPKSQLPAPRKVTPVEREHDPPPVTQHVKHTVVHENRDWHRIIYASLVGLAVLVLAVGQVV